MNLRRVPLQAVVILSLASACSRSPRYTGVGEVVSIDGPRQEITIRHEAIADVRPAGTSRFHAESALVLAGISAGSRIRFEIRRDADGLVLTRATALAEGNPGLHDHTPHHGGVVAMAGMLHLEAVAEKNGNVRLYLTDIWRRPLPLANVSGSVTLTLPNGKQTLPLVAGAEALKAHAPAFERADVHAAFALQRDGESIEMNFLLPVASPSGGVAGVPPDGCVPPPNGSPPALRCTVSFPRPVAAAAATPDGSTAVIAVVDLGMSAWRMPAAELLHGFAPPPAIAVPGGEPPHPEAPNALAVGPDGRELVAAFENRLVRYAMATGDVIKAVNGPGGIIRGVAWSPDGAALLASVFYNAAAHLVSAEDGAEIRAFPVEREGAAVTFAADGRTLAVGSEAGPITLFDTATGAVTRTLAASRWPARAIAFAGDRVLAVTDDGHLRVWNAPTGELVRDIGTDRPLGQLAVAPAGARAAAAGADGIVRLFDIGAGRWIDSFGWHSALVTGLAWAGETVVSGDEEGKVAVWKAGTR